MVNKHLSIYLNDHLAGSTGALELLTNLEEAQSGTPMGLFLTQLHADIEADQRELQRLMERLDITVSAPRKIGAWLGEKAALLKLQMDDKATGSFHLFEGLEALIVGIEGKQGLWRALAVASEAVPELQGVDYERLGQRAVEQQERVEVKRLDTAKEAFTAPD